MLHSVAYSLSRKSRFQVNVGVRVIEITSLRRGEVGRDSVRVGHYCCADNRNTGPSVSPFPGLTARLSRRTPEGRVMKFTYHDYTIVVANPTHD